MILDDHQVTHVELEAHAAGGVGNEQFPDADGHHHADGEDDEVHPVAFVVVDAALHGDDGLAAEGADDEIPLVADGRGDRETGDVLVGDDERVRDLVGQLAEAAAQHDADFGLPAGEDADQVIRRILDPFDSRVHSWVIFSVIVSVSVLCGLRRGSPPRRG